MIFYHAARPIVALCCTIALTLSFPDSLTAANEHSVSPRPSITILQPVHGEQILGGQGVKVLVEVVADSLPSESSFSLILSIDGERLRVFGSEEVVRKEGIVSVGLEGLISGGHRIDVVLHQEGNFDGTYLSCAFYKAIG